MPRGTAVIPHSSVAAFPLAIGWDWWLPPDYSVHGHAIDALFICIFWLTSAIFLGVLVTLVYFMVRYRHDPARKKGLFIHGNTRLEIIWTLIPAVILIALAIVTKGVWDNYRYNALASDPDRAQILVVGEQFKWRVVYPGPDGRLGRYLLYPKTTDLQWPQLPPGASFDFPPVPGPAYMKEAEARKVLDNYIDQINPLGKDFSDPDGVDDDWQNSLARPLEIPKGRPVDITLGSKDVIHDFCLPNFRVKLDAVPGMKGHVVFVAEKSSEEFEKPTRKVYTLDDLEKLLADGDWQAIVGPDSPKAFHERRGRHDWLYKDADGTIVRNGGVISSAADETGKTTIQRLRAIGVTQIEAFKPKYWDLICEELCGQGHYTMTDKVIVLEDDAYRKKYGPQSATAGDSTTDPLAAATPR